MTDKIAVHVYSTQPAKERGNPFLSLNDVETLTLMQSVSKWNEHNGPMILVADEAFIRFVERIGLADLYMDIIILEDIPHEINQNIFWAAAKLKAMQMLGANYYYVDIDLIVNAPLPDTSANLVIAHKDYLETEDGVKYHWQFRPFSEPPSYERPVWLRQEANNWNGLKRSPIDGTGYVMTGFNTSLFMTTDQGFLDEYLAAAFNFMTGNPCTNPQTGWAMMVWAEQVMLDDVAHYRQMYMIQARDYLRDNFIHLQDVKETFKKYPEMKTNFVSLQEQSLNKDISELWHLHKIMRVSSTPDTTPQT